MSPSNRSCGRKLSPTNRSHSVEYVAELHPSVRNPVRNGLLAIGSKLTQMPKTQAMPGFSSSSGGGI